MEQLAERKRRDDGCLDLEQNPHLCSWRAGKLKVAGLPRGAEQLPRQRFRERLFEKLSFHRGVSLPVLDTIHAGGDRGSLRQRRADALAVQKHGGRRVA